MSKNPEKFKIKILNEIKDLFKFKNYNPIYAGFGNKVSDVLAYIISGINKNWIFTINSASIIYLINKKKKLNFHSLNIKIDVYFP